MMLINCLRIVRLSVEKLDRSCMPRLEISMSMSRMSALCIWASVESILWLWREEPSSNSLPKDKNSLCSEMNNLRMLRLSGLRPKPMPLDLLMNPSVNLVEPKSKLKSQKPLRLLPRCCPRIPISLLFQPITVPQTCSTFAPDFFNLCLYHLS